MFFASQKFAAFCKKNNKKKELSRYQSVKAIFIKKKAKFSGFKTSEI